MTASSFGDRLRWWRRRRGLSQLDLATAAGGAQRHVSFLESGRTRPSRETVLRLAAALGVPRRQQNAMRRAAGLAPAWGESDLAAPELAEVSAALDRLLAQQEPYPAVVADRRWNLLRANRGAQRLVAFLTGAAPAGAVNLADALLSPAGLRPTLANWPEVAAYFLRSVQADALADGAPETQALLDRLLAYPDAAALAAAAPVDGAPPPILAMHFRKGDAALRLFTTIATIGTPQDATLQEMRIESFFPADEPTERTLRAWAAD